MSNLNFYELLNASPTATFEELKRNYKQLILQCHPDKLQQQERAVTVNANESDPNRESDSNFNAINEAWNTLKDPTKRKQYDAELLLTKFETHSNIYASITLSDMHSTRIEMMAEEEGSEQSATDADKETTTLSWAYAYNCRCGGQYLLDDESQREQLRACEMIVECSECSLVIIVKPDANVT
ncbi:DPH4 homolog [Drosophila novamexicana]|uniref:DPH4 homolog n=1 Tax=Drosophila novamexicana TaxID=47314 RepID=UPI0011E5DA01|nr:DPH4 homolog [Drosophila novamexicana]XP_030562244.1 DPH4 homolog [Drosophila novamexicana]